jgi:hypothetical protein
MRRIEIMDGLSVRFPNRSDEFVEGVEIGLLAAALAARPARHAADVTPRSVAQAEAFARSLGYRVVTGPETAGLVALTCMREDVKPSFKLVAVASGAAAAG